MAYSLSWVTGLGTPEAEFAFMIAETLTSSGLRTLSLRRTAPELEPAQWLRSLRYWRGLARNQNLGAGCGESTTQGPQRKSAREKRDRLRRISLGRFSKHRCISGSRL